MCAAYVRMHVSSVYTYAHNLEVSRASPVETRVRISSSQGEVGTYVRMNAYARKREREGRRRKRRKRDRERERERRALARTGREGTLEMQRERVREKDERQMYPIGSTKMESRSRGGRRERETERNFTSETREKVYLADRQRQFSKSEKTERMQKSDKERHTRWDQRK